MLLEMAFAAALVGQDSTSRCQVEMGQWVCRTTDGRTPYERGRDSSTRRFNDGMENGAALGAMLRRQRDAEAATRRDREAAALRRNVITLLRQGDCEGAVSVALNAGDLALATEARTFCQATPR